MKINVLEHGIIKDSDELLTEKVQKIIDEFSSPDNFICFPKGKYVLSTVFLKNHTHIFIGKGAQILGAPSFYDYQMQEKIDYVAYQDQSHTYFNCSMFVGLNVSDISIEGKGTIDMRSVWDLDNVRDIVHRGPKCIALKCCNDVKIKDLKILNATDLAVYFAGCNNVEISGLYLKVYIDGISPDCSKNVSISNCYVESGDDGIVFKSSYTLNRLEICDNITVKNCVCKSRCNAIKFGTESNGGFKNISIENIKIFNSRITGISLETVDGAHIENISFKNIKMNNVGTPLFVHIGKRLRGPEGSKIGSIKNVTFLNIQAKGPYKVYKCLPWNYDTFVKNDTLQFPGVYSKQKKEATGTWQITSNICGLKDSFIEDITLKNIYFVLDGGVSQFNKEVPEEPAVYPEVNTYGKILPASGIYFRYIKSLNLSNVKIKLLNKDQREIFVFDHINTKTIS